MTFMAIIEIRYGILLGNVDLFFFRLKVSVIQTIIVA